MFAAPCSSEVLDQKKCIAATGRLPEWGYYSMWFQLLNVKRKHLQVPDVHLESRHM